MIKELFKLWEEMPPEKKIMVITGEGISFASGLTLSDKKEGFWEKDIIKEFLNIETLLYRPEKLWSWVLEKRFELGQVQPNKAHESLKKLEDFFKNNFVLITNNIDGLHSKAGNYRVIEMQGNLLKNKVINKSHYGKEVNWDFIPSNKKGEFLRPDLLVQGEFPERSKILQANLLAQQTDIVLIVDNVINNNHVLELPLLAKKFNNAKIIEINSVRKTTDADLYVKMKSEDILPLLVNLMLDLEKEAKKNAKKDNND